MMSSHTESVPRLPLGGGEEIPQLGFGVFQVPPPETVEAVTGALAAGYRHIDTAAAYRNEAGVGQAIRASGLDRNDVFVTTKCFNDDHGYEEAKHALRASLDRLEMPHVDLYLIHWPVPAHDRYVETWKAFIEMQEEGLTRSIGVSNFQPRPSQEADRGDRRHAGDQPGGAPPAPAATRPAPRARRPGDPHRGLEPAGSGPGARRPGHHGHRRSARPRPPARWCIRWHLQLGNVVIPKSVTPERIEENFDVFGFELSDEEMEQIETLDAGERTGPDPDTFVRP